jgi:hypothetical protein
MGTLVAGRALKRQMIQTANDNLREFAEVSFLIPKAEPAVI